MSSNTRTTTYLLIVGFIHVAMSHKIYSNNPATFRDALQTCRDLGLSLPVDSTDYLTEPLVSVMNSSGVSETWLAMTQSEDSQWRWTDGSKHNGSKPLRKGQERKCATLGEKGKLFGMPCFGRASGYICRQNGCSRCPGGSCVEPSGGRDAICLRKEEITWFEARQECSRVGGELLINPDKETVGKIEQFFHGLDEFWIGLTRNSWQFQLPDKVMVPVSKFRWKTKQRVPLDMKCSIAALNRHETEWKPTKCTERKPYICVEVPSSRKAKAATASSSLLSLAANQFPNGGESKDGDTVTGGDMASAEQRSGLMGMSILKLGLAVACVALLIVCMVAAAWVIRRKLSHRLVFEDAHYARLSAPGRSKVSSTQSAPDRYSAGERFIRIPSMHQAQNITYFPTTTLPRSGTPTYAMIASDGIDYFDMAAGSDQSNNTVQNTENRHTLPRRSLGGLPDLPVSNTGQDPDYLEPTQNPQDGATNEEFDGLR